MWKLSEIKINNIVSITDAVIRFEQGVATLIFGKNEDNASQPCNGSGKSSLIEAISFALTGEQLRKVKTVDEIINDCEDTARVFLTLTNSFNNTVFTIERTISRNRAQVIECHKYDQNGKEIERDKTVQPTVSDYNKFILDEIGLTKDDIYSNYILCDNKFESFFDCSDKSKKEIINRFSNGVMVDDSITRLQEDMNPVKFSLSELSNKVSNIKGSISAIEIELSQVSEKKANAELDRQNMISRVNQQIVECREKIEAEKQKKEKAQVRLGVLDNVRSEILKIEQDDLGLISSYRKIQTLCCDYDLESISDFEAMSEKHNRDLIGLKEEIIDIEYRLNEAEKRSRELAEDYNLNLDVYNRHCDTDAELAEIDNKKKDEINEELAKIDAALDNIEDHINKNKERQSEISVMISRVSALLNGAVTCPQCQHKFFLNSEQSVESVKEQLEKLNKEKAAAKDLHERLSDEFKKIDSEGDEKEKELDNINKEIRNRAAKIDDEYAKVKRIYSELINANKVVSDYGVKLNETKGKIEKISSKVDVLCERMFGEINGIIDGRISNGKNYVVQCESSIEYLTGQMEQRKKYKKELVDAPETDFESSLKDSLAKYTEALTDAENSVYNVQMQYNLMKEQELNFIQFKSYLANKKIGALSSIVNDFLEKIGSDIRLKLDGFTMTKTGKLRDKISVQVMRDGIDCGSFQKFSGGEKARLNLACILSLHALTNANCEDGKGLDFIIIDELLDKSDEVGMSTYCDALNKLNQTALLITQGAVSEGYPHKLLIIKKQGVSSIINH